MDKFIFGLNITETNKYLETLNISNLSSLKELDDICELIQSEISHIKSNIESSTEFIPSSFEFLNEIAKNKTFKFNLQSSIDAIKEFFESENEQTNLKNELEVEFLEKSLEENIMKTAVLKSDILKLLDKNRIIVDELNSINNKHQEGKILDFVSTRKFQMSENTTSNNSHQNNVIKFESKQQKYPQLNESTNYENSIQSNFEEKNVKISELKKASGFWSNCNTNQSVDYKFNTDDIVNNLIKNVSTDMDESTSEYDILSQFTLSAENKNLQVTDVFAPSNNFWSINVSPENVYTKKHEVPNPVQNEINISTNKNFNEPSYSDNFVVSSTSNIPDIHLIREKLIIGKIAGETLFSSSGNIIINAGDEITAKEIKLAENEGLLSSLILNMTLPEIKN